MITGERRLHEWIKGRDFRLTDVHGQLVTGLCIKHASVGHGAGQEKVNRVTTGISE